MSSVNNIRAVGAESAEALTAIHRACFPHYWDHEAFTDFFSVGGTHALLIDGAAMMVYRVQHEQADIITIAVLPEFRRHGLAKALMERALAHIRGLGASTLFLDVEDGNLAAVRLYEGLGFKEIRRRKLYYRQKDGSYTDALVMSRKLA